VHHLAEGEALEGEYAVTSQTSGLIVTVRSALTSPPFATQTVSDLVSIFCFALSGVDAETLVRGSNEITVECYGTHGAVLAPQLLTSESGWSGQ
jgi:hypothetical protein